MHLAWFVIPAALGCCFATAGCTATTPKPVSTAQRRSPIGVWQTINSKRFACFREGGKMVITSKVARLEEVGHCRWKHDAAHAHRGTIRCGSPKVHRWQRIDDGRLLLISRRRGGRLRRWIMVPFSKGPCFQPNAVYINPDPDGDGVLRAADKCPEKPEDFDGFEDQDGCPDLDNDKDGVPDKQDQCPNQAGKAPSGCAHRQRSADRDGDGIPDSADSCPDDPEDKDGFADHDGCPDPDNDKDGIADVDDRCPNQRAKKNSKDGC
jgi:hypothetical protein